VLSPANSPNVVEAKKAKYAGAGIPWYWEVDMDGDAIAAVRAYALALSADLADGVVPLRPRNYILTGGWSPDDTGAVESAHPFPIRIDWDALAF
jgi:hypothetical protein